MLDQVDHGISPRLGIRNFQIEPIEAKKVPHCFKRSPLVPLLEGMSLRNSGKQPHPEYENILLAIGKCILRPG